MERDIIIRKVLARMNEVTHAEQVDIIPDALIGQMLEEGLRSFLMTVPVHLIKDHVLYFASTPAIVNTQDNTTGYVPLPPTFLRLIIFRLHTWKTPVTSAISADSPEYRVQFNRHLRGSINRPVVAIRTQSSKQQILEYFSTQNNDHTIDEALCVSLPVVEQLQDDLVDAYCWMVASTVLGVMGETAGAQMAMQKFSEYITLNSNK